MFIRNISYKDLTSGLEIDNVAFQEGTNLLVGNSGAGKTRILRAIYDAGRLAIGRLKRIESSFELTLEFTVGNPLGLEEGDNIQKECRWKVCVEYRPWNRIQTAEENFAITKEFLEVDGERILFRGENSVKVLGYDSVPQPKENESLISQYRSERQIISIYFDFFKILFWQFETESNELVSGSLYKERCKNFSDYSYASRMENMPIFYDPFSVYGILKTVDPAEFQKITEDILEVYQEIFPEVEDISYRSNNFDEYGIAIKVKDFWITQKHISSGMLKTLWSLLYFKMLPKDSVVLIDELEDGLGVNCIEDVSDFIMNTRPDVQVLATSHHPYIINAIPMDNWVIIQRENQKIRAANAQEMSLGKSRHDAYLQLVNRLQN